VSAEEMLRDIDRMCDEGLFEPNEWEHGFLNSVEDRLAFGFDLSEAQEDKLRQIWKRACE
jgi:hypothetical protein